MWRMVLEELVSVLYQQLLGGCIVKPVSGFYIKWDTLYNKFCLHFEVGGYYSVYASSYFLIMTFKYQINSEYIH
jgi:hypothetical protein